MRLAQIEGKGNRFSDADLALAIEKHGRWLAVGGAGVNHRRATKMFHELDGSFTERGLGLRVHMFRAHTEGERFPC